MRPFQMLNNHEQREKDLWLIPMQREADFEVRVR